MTIQTPLQLVITIGIIALGTFLIRALPFFLFPAGKETPRVVAYLGAGPVRLARGQRGSCQHHAWPKKRVHHDGRAARLSDRVFCR